MAKRFNIAIGLIIFLFCFQGYPVAKEINFSASVDKSEISVDEEINLNILVSGDVGSIPQPKLPSLSDFEVYSSGRSQNISFVNGRLSSSVSFNYVLVPKNKGQFTIGSAEVEIDNKAYRTQPMNITVTDAPSVSQAPPAAEKEQPTNSSLKGKETDLFVETVVDKNKAYVGEQITLTFRFYQGVRLFGNQEYSRPNLTGFWVEDLPPQRRYYKTVNGKQYFVTEVKTALFPTTPGKQTIGSANLKVTVEDLRDFFDTDPFSLLDRDMFSAFRQGKPKILSTKPIDIEIIPLPQKGQPETFKGAVGRFSLSASLDKTQTEEGQPLNLKVKISGQGNLMSMAEPESIKIEDFRFYNVGGSKNISKDNFTVQGSRTYDMSLVPQKAGKYNIPPIQFSYFDLAGKEYKILQSQPFSVTVLPGKEGQVTVFPQNAEVEVKMKDIRYIKTDTGRLRNEEGNFCQTPLFIIINLIPLVVLIASLGYRRYQSRLETDIGYARLKRAGSSAKKRLAVARKSITGKDAKKFYSEIAKALLQYVGDKTNRSAFGLTKDEIRSELREKNINRQKIDELAEFLDLCDYARFTPGSSTPEELAKTLKSAEKLIIDLEREYV